MANHIVDFFIVGTQKGGTTALDRALRSAPGIQMASRKEVHFFDREDVDWSQPSYEELHACFDWSGTGVMRGETTPIYMFWPGSLRRLRAYNSEARLVVLLRHPVHRAYSHWKMKVQAGQETLSFDEAVSDAGRGRAIGSATARRLFSYVERGLYRPQFEEMFTHFPKERILIVKSDAFRAEPVGVLARICSFLGTGNVPHQARDEGYVVAVDTRSLPDIRPEDARRNASLFRQDIIDTMALTGIDLSEWLDPDYREFAL